MSAKNNLDFYKNIFNNLPIPIFTTNIKTGCLIDVNEEANLLLGLENSPIHSIHYTELFPKNEIQTITELFENNIKLLAENKKTLPIEKIIYNKNNNFIPVEITHTLTQKDNESVLITLVKDITEEKKHQNILSYYDKALEKSSAFLSLVDKNHVYQSVNESYAKFFNKTKEEIIGISIMDLLGEEYFNKNVKEKFEKTLNGTHESYEAEVLLPNGKNVHFSVDYEPYYSLENEIIGVVISVHEITKYKEVFNANLKNEKILIQQSKMAAMGEMLENIAHQWRQPLSLISTCASGLVLQRELVGIDDKTLDDSLKKIVDTTFYLSDTIDDFKNFFKRDKERTNFCINEVTTKTIELMHMNFSNIEIIKDMKDNITINSYPNEFMQVLLNIINNSKDALLQDNESADKKNLIIISIYKDKNKDVIEIKDNAGGIPSDIIEKVFEPYFTTKHQAQGTGIGLFMTREIITKHMSGEIQVENTEFIYEETQYKGALFRIIL
jgi:PAS domain S-box-containing protein